MACIFPGAGDLETFWRNVRGGHDAIREVSPKRWEPSFFDPNAHGVDRVYCNRGGFIDEFATFELWDYTLSADSERPTHRVGSYARRAYLDGLSLAREGKGNPFRFGLIGDSDTHNAAAANEEYNYTGKFAVENDPRHRLEGFGGTPAQTQQVREFAARQELPVLDETAIEAGLQQKAEEFKALGGELYVKETR